MSAQPWHKRYHSDALSGMLALTLEERGAYQTVLDLIYDRGGPIMDNERLLSGYMGCSIRKWRALREALLRKGKLTAANGLLSNSRAEKEIENDAKTRRKRAENGLKGGRKKSENEKKINENNENCLAEVKQNSSLIPEARSQKPDTAKAVSAGACGDDGEIVSLTIRLCRTAGIEMPDPGRNFFRHGEYLALVAGWLKAGADSTRLEQCISQGAEAARSRITSLRYFDGAVNDMIAGRGRYDRRSPEERSTDWMVKDILARNAKKEAA